MAAECHTAPPALHVEGLCFSYPQHTLFAQWSAQFGPGLTLVLGGDGRGKTTLLRLLAGVLAPQAGRLHLNGQDSRQAGHCPQVFWADPQSTDWDQHTPRAYMAQQSAVWPRFNPGLWYELAEALALTPHLDKPMFMLSTGSQRKVWLATAFAAGAPVTLLDTPFAALDRTSIQVVQELLHDAADDTTHIWVLADSTPPGDADDLPLAGVVSLD